VPAQTASGTPTPAQNDTPAALHEKARQPVIEIHPVEPSAYYTPIGEMPKIRLIFSQHLPNAAAIIKMMDFPLTCFSIGELHARRQS
jgi:hypothetical protein